MLSARPENYRTYAEECWKFANDADDIETKAVFQLTAEAWTMLAAQVEAFEGAAIATRPLLQSSV